MAKTGKIAIGVDMSRYFNSSYLETTALKSFINIF